MSVWTHRHILDLATFSHDDFGMVLELAHRFRTMPLTGARKLPALQGRLVATLFFEPSTRTRSSFELAAKRLSADVQSFAPSSSSLSKGESLLDTARTYVAMGADMLVVRHKNTSVPQQLAEALEASGERTMVLNGGDGLHSHPSQGLLDLYTLAQYFDPQRAALEVLQGKHVLIVGDILHSRVARSNLFKAAIFGNDPNWGRVLAAIGTTDASFDPFEVDVAFNGVRVCHAGEPDRPREEVDLTPRETRIRIELHAGEHAATIRTNDLTHEYVHENSAYAS